jgi:hypothetical protein
VQARDLEDRAQHVAASLTALVESLEGQDASEFKKGAAVQRTATRSTHPKSFQIAFDDFPSRRKRSHT